MTNRNHNRAAESGNIFLMVMLGVVLFAALMFTFSRSARQGGENLSEKQIEIIVTSILSDARKMESVLNRLTMEGCSQQEVSFDHPMWPPSHVLQSFNPYYYSAVYNNLSAPVDKHCHVFDPAGGGLSWIPPVPGANDGTPWVYSGAMRITGMGSDFAALEKNQELIMYLPFLKKSVCEAINKKLHGTTTIPSVWITSMGGFNKYWAYTGVNTGGWASGCWTSPLGIFSNNVQVAIPEFYTFFHILFVR
jgi:hypothetical protein